MNAYSKIGSSATTHKSRSLDFSDFFQTPKPVTPTNLQAVHPPQSQSKKEDEGERFGVILGRSCSVSSSSSSSASASGFQATMKRAFSIKRSSSVSERYCRIHDQSMAIASDELDINNDGSAGKTTEKKRQRGGKILKACKRLVGL